jgi:IS5 family transposase
MRSQKRAAAGHLLTDAVRERNQRWSRARAFVEHPYHVVKRLWGFAKIRYRDHYKNIDRVFAHFALANLYRVRRRLLPQGAYCFRRTG